MFCGECGQENPAGKKFCAACGAVLTPTTAPGRAAGSGGAVPLPRLIEDATLPGVAARVLLGGRWEVVKPLGEGGMGQVYLARNRTLRVLVAVKLIGPQLRQDPEATARLTEEARRVGVDDRSRRARDEDGGRRLSARLQHRVRDRRGQPRDGGGGGHQYSTGFAGPDVVRTMPSHPSDGVEALRPTTISRRTHAARPCTAGQSVTCSQAVQKADGGLPGCANKPRQNFGPGDRRDPGGGLGLFQVVGSRRNAVEMVDQEARIKHYVHPTPS